MSIASDNKKAREWLMRKMMSKDMANAIIDMDDATWSEGIGFGDDPTSAWVVLVGMAEEVTGRESHQHQERKKAQ
jgi:hypothetical protein